MTLNLAILISGGGSNLQSIIDKIESGALDARIKTVISNKPGVGGLARAAKHNIPHQVLDHKNFADRASYDQALAEAIHRAGADTVVLAGFMRILGPGFIKAFPGRVVNIHPALLPSFAGGHGQRDAADYGVKLSGCTVHFADEIMDHGPIIIQAAVPAQPGESGEALGARILTQEHRCYPQALQWLAQGRLRIEGRHVHLDGPAGPLAEIADAALINPPLEKGF